ncbi:hypothetical protein CH302_23760 [Rhodococcus sp. 15-2388-1-1a]|nr:hypothetical protein CH302_23760 [Rhodococcus sp. 15-2388-1-1a]
MSAVRRVADLDAEGRTAILLRLAVEHPTLVDDALARRANYTSCNSRREQSRGTVDTGGQGTMRERSGDDVESVRSQFVNDQQVHFSALIPVVS